MLTEIVPVKFDTEIGNFPELIFPTVTVSVLSVIDSVGALALWTVALIYCAPGW